MYIKLLIADIKIVLTVVIIIFIVLIFPIFINVRIFFCKELNKLFFTLNIFTFKVVSGYVQKITEGIVIHITKNFAIIVPAKNLLGIGKSVKPLKDYHFIRFYTTFDIGSEDGLFEPLVFGFIINYIHRITHWFFYNHKPYIMLNNNINIFENTKKFNITTDVLILLNLLMIIISIIKIILEKMIYAFRNKKQQN